MSWSRIVRSIAIVLAWTGMATAVAGLAIPVAAPVAMTMATMDGLLGVERFQDDAHCDFWVLDMQNPTQRIERSFDCGFFWDWSTYDGGLAYVQEVLLDHDEGGVFEVPGMPRGRMEEWYHVDGHMLRDGALEFAVPGAGVLMPPPGSAESLIMGWVESGGEKGGDERLVVPRDLRETGRGEIGGIPTVQWESRFSRVPATWHGHEVLLSEDIAFDSDPATGWILRRQRHVLVEMTPAQIAVFLGVPSPPVLAGLLDEGGTQAIMELDYQTTAAGESAHVEEDRFFRSLMAPIGHGTTLAWVGTAVAVVFAGTAVLVKRWWPPRRAPQVAAA